MKRFFTSKIFFFAFLLIFNWLTPNAVFPQLFSFEEVTTTDARTLAMGNPHALSREFTNPAYLSFLSEYKVSASLHNRFQMSELNTSGLRFVLPNKFIDAGFQFSHFGYQDYNFLSFQTGLAKQINERFSIGSKINLTYLNNFLDEHAQTGVKVGIGGVYQLSEPVRICLLAENIASTSNEKDYSLHFGLDYQCLPNLNLSSEISYNFEKQINLSLGAEYQIIDELFFRAGFRTYCSIPSLGAAYTFKNIEIGIAFTSHRTLGGSSMIEIGYKF